MDGWEEEKAELRRLIQQDTLTVLFGKSGLGKTSLLMAGVFPLLRQDGILPVYVRIDPREPSTPLITQTRAALRLVMERERIDAPPMRDEETLWEYLHRPGFSSCGVSATSF